jgi:hypothetical protein
MELVMFIKKIFILTIGVVGVFLASCSSNKEKPATVAMECSFPDAPTVPAPVWVCDERIKGFDVAAVGSAHMSRAGYGFTEQMASTAARVKLAQRMKVQVQNMIKQYAEVTGAADTETVDKVNTSVSKQITDASLIGSRVLKKITSPNKNLYVMVGLDAKSVQKITKNSINSSLNNENALWQQFKSKQGQDELANSIANQK